MTVLWGDTGKIAYGSLKTTTITLPTARETPITQVTLPTTEPGIPQISYTVQASDLATFSGNIPKSVVHVPFVFATGKIGAASTIINYRILLNGVSQAQGGSVSVAAGLYYTIEQLRYIPVNVGDVITVSLWSSQADTTFNYHAFTTCYTRPQLTKPGTILKDVTYNATGFPTLTQAPSPIAVSTQQNFLPYPYPGNSAGIGSGVSTFGALVQDSTYYMGRANYGDSNNNYQISSHATNQTNYPKNFMPTSISFREILR